MFTGGCGVCPQPGVDEKEWDEDCLQCNVWVPVGEAPEGGMFEEVVFKDMC